MNISVNHNQAKIMYNSIVNVSRLYVREMDAVYLRARREAKAARERKALNEVRAIYRNFKRETGLTMREFSKLRKLLSTVSSF